MHEKSTSIKITRKMLSCFLLEDLIRLKKSINSGKVIKRSCTDGEKGCPVHILTHGTVESNTTLKRAYPDKETYLLFFRFIRQFDDRQEKLPISLLRNVLEDVIVQRKILNQEEKITIEQAQMKMLQKQREEVF